jgi:hypothetical protein
VWNTKSQLSGPNPRQVLRVIPASKPPVTHLPHCNFIAAASDQSCLFSLPFYKGWPQKPCLIHLTYLDSISEMIFQETQPKLFIITTLHFPGQKWLKSTSNPPLPWPHQPGGKYRCHQWLCAKAIYLEFQSCPLARVLLKGLWMGHISIGITTFLVTSWHPVCVLLWLSWHPGAALKTVAQVRTQLQSLYISNHYAAVRRNKKSPCILYFFTFPTIFPLTIEIVFK